MGSGKILAIGAWTLFAVIVGSQVFAQENIVEKRKAYMRENYEDFKAIKRAVEEKNYATVALKAKDLADRFDTNTVLALFPKGSTAEKSRAKAEIWEHWDDFSKLPVKVKDVANSLAKAAAAKDEAGVEKQSSILLGPQGSPYRGSGPCYDCHKTYLNQTAPAKQ